MEEVSKEIFAEKIIDFEWIPFTQTIAYCHSIVAPDTLHYFLNDSAQPQIGCVGYVRRKAGLKMLCVYGECLKQIQSADRKQLTAFYQSLKETGYDIYELNSSTPYHYDREIALRRAGWLRPIGSYSTTLSKSINLCQQITYDKSWKRNLQKAHSEDLTFSVTAHPSSEQITNYVKHHRELLQRKHFGGELTIAGLAELFNDSDFRLCTITTPQGEEVSGGIFYARKNNAAFMYSYTTARGRELSASYMLYECIFRTLAEEGVASFDIGRLSPAAHNKDNLFLFKDGIDGDYVQYVGEWEWCRNGRLSALLYFLKNNIWKRVRV